LPLAREMTIHLSQRAQVVKLHPAVSRTAEANWE